MMGMMLHQNVVVSMGNLASHAPLNSSHLLGYAHAVGPAFDVYLMTSELGFLYVKIMMKLLQSGVATSGLLLTAAPL